MNNFFFLLFIIISVSCFGQTIRDTIRVGDSAVVVQTTKVVNTKTGAVSYTYKDTNTTVSKTKIYLGTTVTPNQPPSANAGADQTIILPLSSVNLVGSGQDKDGAIAGYSWSKVSGGTAIIANANQSSTSVNNLTIGVYIFRLTVTDNDGAIGTDDVTVTVNSPTQTGKQDTSQQGFGKNNGGNGKPIVTVTSGSALANAIKSNTYIKIDNKASGSWSFRGNYSNLVNVTIDGSESTFPIVLDNGNNGDGLSFEGSGCHDIIIKSISVRNAGNDNAAINNGGYKILFDHCSFSNGGDGSLDITTGSHDITVQWCIIGSAVSGASLFDYPGTKNLSVHHNLYLAFERNALIGSQQKAGRTDMVCDFTNNVVWNWKNYGTDVNNNGTANIRNNYYYSTSNPNSAVLTAKNSYGTYPQGFAYVSGNFSGNGVNIDKQSNNPLWPVPAEFSTNMQDACTAARLVVAGVGPVKKDATDLNFIKQVTLPGCPAQ